MDAEPTNILSGPGIFKKKGFSMWIGWLGGKACNYRDYCSVILKGGFKENYIQVKIKRMTGILCQ
jgi:hypothetical protein